MRLAISNIAWPSGADAAVTPLLHTHRVEGVELALTKVWPEPLDVTADEVRAYRAAWEKQGLPIVALQALLFGKPHLTLFGRESTRGQTLDYLAGMIERAGELGARALVFGSPKNRQRQGRNPDEAWAIAVSFFRELGRIARRHGVCFCIEPNPPAYGCDFVTTVAEGIELVDAVADEGFGLHLDSAGMNLAGDPPAASILAAADRCRHFHVSAPFLAEISGESVPHGEFAQGLRRAKYQGWLSIEMGEAKETGAWATAIERSLAFVRAAYSLDGKSRRIEVAPRQDMGGPNVHTTAPLRLIRHSPNRREGCAERWLFALTAILSVLLFSIPAWPLLSGRVPIYLDLGLFHLPIRAFYSRCLTAGQSFDWIPHLYGGMFLTGEGEHGPYHPLHLLLYRWLPLDVAFSLETFLHCPLLFVGLFVFLRRYVRGTAALRGALCYTFCYSSILHNIYPNYQGVIAHLPWLLWLMDLASATTSAPRRRLALSAFALLTGSQLLLGAPQALSFSLFAEGLFAIFLAWHRRPRWTFWAAWIGANLLGLLIGAVQILATRALLANSTRGHFDPMIGSLLPSQLLQLLAPNLLSRHLPSYACSEPLYFGAVPLILALWWLAGQGSGGCQPPDFTYRHQGANAPRSPTKSEPTPEVAANRLGLFALVLGVLACWLALGEHGYLYYLQTRLPLVGQFRLPGRYFTLVAFAASILSAVAFDRLLGRMSAGGKASWRQIALPWACVGVALMLAIAFRLAYPKENGSSIHRNYFAGPLFLCGAAAALTMAARGRMVGLFALVALTVVDLEVFSLQAPFWRESLWSGLPTLQEFQNRAESPPLPREGRWLDGAFEVPHPALFGQPVLEGYHGGLEPRKRLDYHTIAALRVAHTAWQHLSRFDKPTPIPGLRRMGEYWYEVPDPLPHVRLVSRTLVSEEPAADIQRIDLDTTALVTHPVEVEAGEAGRATLLQEQPGDLRVRVEAPGRRLLVVAESYDPDWRLTVDDKPVTVERVNGDFLGCVVEGGAHDVRFRFRPTSVLYGRLLSLSGFGIVLLIAGVSCLQLFTRSRREADERRLVRPCG